MSIRDALTVLIIQSCLNYDISGRSGTVRVPMLRVLGTFDGAEVLILAAASILIISITFLF